MKYLKRYKFVWIALATLIFIRWFIVDNYFISSGSMRGTLIEGDYVLVSKLSYGPRLPKVIKIPFIDYDGPILRVINWHPFLSIHDSNIRLPFGKVNRNDIIAFDPPHMSPDRVSLYIPFIKRCVGIPGDSIKIVDGKLFVNQIQNSSNYKKDYLITLNDLNDANKITNRIQVVDKNRKLIKISAKEYEVEKLKNEDYILDLREELQSKDYVDFDVFPYSSEFPSNRDNVSEFRLPSKGMSVILNPASFSYYSEAINLYEGVTLARHKDGSFLINGATATHYTFTQNYYFAIGDNWDYSVDSRFWGMFPEKFIHGKVTMIWFSRNDKIEWSRIFTRL